MKFLRQLSNFSIQLIVRILTSFREEFQPSYASQYLSYPFLFLLLISFDSVLKAQLDAIGIILIQANTLLISNFLTHIG